MLPDWICAYALTASKAISTIAAIVAARNPRDEYRFISAPFVESCPLRTLSAFACADRWPNASNQTKLMYSMSYVKTRASRAAGRFNQTFKDVPFFEASHKIAFAGTPKKARWGCPQRAVMQTTLWIELERQTRADAEYARRENFRDAVAACGKRRASGRGVELRHVALQDRVGVHQVESVDGERQTDPLEAELLGQAHVDLSHRRVPEGIDRVRHEKRFACLTRARSAFHDPHIRQRVTLAGIDVEPERRLDDGDLVRARQVSSPLRIDVDVALRSAAVALEDDLGIVADTAETQAAGIDDRTGTDVLLPVLHGEVAAHHPAMRQTLGRGELESLVVLVVIRGVSNDVEDRSRNARCQNKVRE